MGPTEGYGQGFRLSIRGTGVGPSRVPARVWIGLLDHLLAAVEAVADTKGAPGKGRFGVSELREGSVEPVMVPLDEMAGPGLRFVVAEMAAGRAHHLPASGRQAAETVARFCEHYDGSVAVYELSAEEPLAVLDSRVRPRVRVYKEFAVVYGRPFRVGGRQDEVTIHLEVEPVGARLVCAASREVARRVAQRMWEPIALEGIATWNIDTRQIEGFTVHEMLPYEPISPAKAFEELRRIGGPDAWGEDPLAAIAEFRRGGDDA